MKGTKLLLSIWLATAAFCLLQILFGPGGFSETARLKEQQARLEVRLETLKQDNQRLNARYESLRSSAEAIRLEARSLGWFGAGEIPVRTLDGADFRLPPEAPDLSVVPRLGPSSFDLSLFFRLVWPLLLVSFYTAFYLLEKMLPARGWSEWVETSRNNLPVPFQTGLDFFRK